MNAKIIGNVCLFVNPYFVFHPNAQHTNKLEIESLIRVELSLTLSGFVDVLWSAPILSRWQMVNLDALMRSGPCEGWG